MLFDLQKDDEVTTILRTKLPQEPVNHVLEYVPDKLAAYMDVRAMKFTPRSEMTHMLKAHILTLYSHLDSRNCHFWGALLSPAGHLNAEPADYTPGSVRDAGGLATDLSRMGTDSGGNLLHPTHQRERGGVSQGWALCCGLGYRG